MTCCTVRYGATGPILARRYRRTCACLDRQNLLHTRGPPLPQIRWYGFAGRGKGTHMSLRLSEPYGVIGKQDHQRGVLTTSETTHSSKFGATLIHRNGKLGCELPRSSNKLFTPHKNAILYSRYSKLFTIPDGQLCNPIEWQRPSNYNIWYRNYLR